MRRITGFTLGVSLLLGFEAHGALAQDEERPKRDPKDCVRVTSEARPRDYAYEHVVHLENTCAATVTCRVSTDANPEAQSVTLEPNEKTSVVTFRGSPAREFTPKVECERQK